MMDLQISPDNRFAAAYTNNNQTILLNTLVSEFVIIDSPLETNETVQGIFILDTVLLIYGQTTWSFFDMAGKEIEKRKTFREDPILTITMESKDDLSIVHWSGDMTRPAMALETYKNSKIGQVLEFNHAIAINKAQTLCWVSMKLAISMVTFVEFYSEACDIY